MTITATFILAVMLVESGNNPNARGKAGEIGPLQITPAVVEDVNAMQDQVHFDIEDALDPVRARAIFTMYVSHYCTRERLGREPTLRDAAMTWHLGLTGWRRALARAHSDTYWHRVEALMKDMEAKQ